MDTQLNREMNLRDSQVFIPESSPSYATPMPWNICKAAFMTLTGLIAAALLVAVCVLLTPGATQDIKAEEVPEKIKQTYHLQEADADKEYTIFTAQRRGLYVIHGHVVLEDSQNYQSEVVYLERIWRKGNREEIQKLRVSCSQEIIFVTECKMDEGYRVYLLFNTGSPNRTATVFNVYEL